MPRTSLKEIGIDLEKFPYEKAGFTREEVQGELQKACNNNFDFSTTKELNAVQTFASVRFYNINAESNRSIFNADLYFSDKISVKAKKEIYDEYKAYERMGRARAYKIPRTVADVYNKIGLQRTYSLLKARINKEDFAVDDTVMTEHVYHDHVKESLTGGRIIGRQKYESRFLEDPKDLFKEALLNNLEKVARWMASPTKEDLVFSYDFGRQIGEGLDFDFRKVNCNVTTLVLKKDNALERGEHICKNANDNALGFIARTFFPPVTKGEKTNERISYKTLQENNKDIEYLKTPLYRTYAWARDEYDSIKNCAIKFNSGKSGRRASITVNCETPSGDTVIARIDEKYVNFSLKSAGEQIYNDLEYAEAFHKYPEFFEIFQAIENRRDEELPFKNVEFGDKVDERNVVRPDRKDNYNR